MSLWGDHPEFYERERRIEEMWDMFFAVLRVVAYTLIILRIILYIKSFLF
jgi:hypothetical protein